MKAHITVIAVIDMIGAAFLALIALAGSAFGGVASLACAKTVSQSVAGLAATGTIVGFLLVWAAFKVCMGVALMNGRNWSRILHVLFAVPALFNFWLGTLIGVYTLWVLLSDEGAAQFHRAF